jgi:hypothetical protein
MHSRPRSFADRQYYLQVLYQARNLSIECERGESPASGLRTSCEELCASIDRVVGELVGDTTYFQVEDVQKRA